MNNLSWLLYFAGVCGNIQGVFIFFAVVIGVITVGSGVVWICSCEEYEAKLHKSSGKVLARFALPALFACTLVSAFIPSEKTVYLIAASQTGDKALHTETGQKAIAAIDRYLDSVGVDKDVHENNQTSK